ncbi:Bug family tripartite tricarboxylate transporter substrate binding protein [Natronobeatus ordinarius]|uniref:Bug family tripartite tricarboxylate transporter substrate binding protein n=1 Tax=Natronobeatus ordinarius TaxID=2963433 RepID=UPI0020CF36BF|nr:tripartite tricarboxylate transporter substrate-binding protein [Natronobeatus ordinarius]
MERRTFLKSAGVATAVGISGFAGCLGNGDDDDGDDTGNGAESDPDFPSDTLTWMIPWSEGGGTDTYARQVQPGAADHIGESIDIDNRPGAGSMAGSDWLATQDNDGYTFGTINSVGAHFTWAAQNADIGLDFHIEDDFEPISTIGTFGYTLIVNRDIGEEHGIEDYGALRDAYQDGDISGFGYQGMGSDSHFTTLVLREDYGLEYDTAVPYDGGGPTAEAVQSGEVAAGFATNTSAMNAEQGGEAYTVVNLMDVDLTDTWPDIDQISNYGDSLAWITEFQQTQVAPAGTPEEERQAISEAMEAGVNSDDAQAWAEETGNILQYGDMDAAEEAWFGIVEQQESQVEAVVGGFDEFLAMADE